MVYSFDNLVAVVVVVAEYNSRGMYHIVEVLEALEGSFDSCKDLKVKKTKKQI